MTFSFNVNGLTPQDIDTGGGSPMPSGTTVVQPSTAHDIAFWVDGTYNTISGRNETTKKMENLIPLPAGTTNVTMSNTSVWNGNFLELKTYARYPYKFGVNGQDFSLDTIFRTTKQNTETLSLIHNSYDATGFALLINSFSNEESGKIRFCASKGTELINVYSDFQVEVGKTYYVCGVCKSNSVLELHIYDGSNVYTTSTEFPYSFKVNSTYNIAIGTGSNSSSTTNNYEGLELGMCRIWNKALTAQEISNNYQDAKNRFGI